MTVTRRFRRSPSVFQENVPDAAKAHFSNHSLDLKDRCDVCNSIIQKADAGDGPAVFIMFIVGFVAVAIAFIARFAFFASILVSFLISLSQR
ncbi:MAG: DUF983 domain-containing protein [Parvularculaceae bacterium]